MKGLILKDLYAMERFYRNTLFSMVIVCGCFGFSLGAEGVTAATAIMCATMVVSTFSLKVSCPQSSSRLLNLIKALPKKPVSVFSLRAS